MAKKQRISYTDAEAIEKTLISEDNIGPPNTGIMGAHMVTTYKTIDGRTLVNEWGNGGGEWYFKTPNVKLSGCAAARSNAD